MSKVDGIIARVIARESPEFTNNPSDSGGPTKYGITQGALSRFLRRPATVAEVQSLDAVSAREFYFWKQVHEPEFDAIVVISEPIGAELIDTGTLCGPGRAAQFLQECLNAFNNGGKLYEDVAADGDAGMRTRVALRTFLMIRKSEGEAVMVAALNSKLGSFLLDLAASRPKDEEFCYGWIKSRVFDAA